MIHQPKDYQAILKNRFLDNMLARKKMIKKNILMYLLIAGCSNVVSLHSAFHEWMTWAYKEGALKGTAEISLSLVGALAQCGKKPFGLSELEAVNLVNQKIQMHFHITQLLTNLRQIMTNEYYKNLSVYDQLVAYHLSLSTAQISRNTLMIQY